jgi:site-specific DNA recombinase
VLLSFAQFEREVTGKRIRDKIAASKRKGMWVGGVVPFGYRLDDRKLQINDAETAIVQQVFASASDTACNSALASSKPDAFSAAFSSACRAS